MPTSVKQFFDEKVPSALLKNPDKVKDVAAIYHFKVTGPDGGEWTADLASATPSCVVGLTGTAACVVEASDDDFRSMIDGGMSAAMQLFFSGKLKITGDPNLATKLTKVLQLGQGG